MRIGILTLPLHTNYGGILQAYALQTVLERMGHEVVVLQKSNYRKEPSYIEIISRIFQKKVLHKKIHVFAERDNNKYVDSITTYIWPFVKKHIRMREFSGYGELKEDDYDAIIVGSDQIWRPEYARSKDEDMTNAFLAFIKGKSMKRISYAASFGKDNLEEFTPDEIVKCGNLLKQFDAVSVREDSGIALCKQYFNTTAKQMLDPTLLLSADDYRKLFRSTETKTDGLLCYVLDKSLEVDKLIDKVAHEKNLSPFFVNDNTDYTSVQPPVEKWLEGFHKAGFVITDSFHACVFSIIFHKPFIVIGNANRGMARFESLVKQFVLEKHILKSVSDYSNTIDYSIHPSVYTVLETKRNESLSYLSNSLS